MITDTVKKSNPMSGRLTTDTKRIASMRRVVKTGRLLTLSDSQFFARYSMIETMPKITAKRVAIKVNTAKGIPTTVRDSKIMMARSTSEIAAPIPNKRVAEDANSSWDCLKNRLR